jgi:protein tyrosine phosphatase (PTP) superfamily phosphohydrolase (DUF442 family)
VLLPVLLLGCRSTKDDRVQTDYPPLKSTEMGTMINVCVAGPIWFGGSPSLEDLDLAKRRGIESVIDLCEVETSAGLSARCEQLGMEYLSVPIKAASNTRPGTVDFILSNLTSSEDKPTLMFCDTGGVSAMFFAIYRVVHDEVEVEEALVEARKAGMKPGDPEEFVLLQIERLTGWTLIESEPESAE